MARTALFVDLSNFYSCLLNSRIKEPRFLMDYFLHWMDFDLLAQALTPWFLGIWVFYSGERIGPSNYRIIEKQMQQYVTRINNLEGVTAYDVNIPGEERARGTFLCENCGQENEVEWKGEKGVDTSLIVYLFDTMESWDTAYLLSGDADFVPAVASLRRRGKIVIGAGFSDASSALVRECYQYIDLCDAFLKDDVAAYTVFKPDGIAQRWLTREIRPNQARVTRPAQPLELSISWARIGTRKEPGRYRVDLSASAEGYANVTGLVDFSERQQEIAGFQADFPDQVRSADPKTPQYSFWVSPLAWAGVERRLQTFALSKGNLQYDARARTWIVGYQFNPDADKYEPVSRLNSQQ